MTEHNSALRNRMARVVRQRVNRDRKLLLSMLTARGSTAGVPLLAEFERGVQRGILSEAYRIADDLDSNHGRWAVQQAAERNGITLDYPPVNEPNNRLREQLREQYQQVREAVLDEVERRLLDELELTDEERAEGITARLLGVPNIKRAIKEVRGATDYIREIVGLGDGRMEVTLDSGTKRILTEEEYLAWPRRHVENASMPCDCEDCRI